VQDVIDKLRPPGHTKKNRSTLYRLIGRVTARMAADGQKSLEAFFPLTASNDDVARHGSALSIPRFPFDTDASYQERVAVAAYYLERQGIRWFVKEFLDQLIPGRYSLLEYPKIGFRVGYSPLGASSLGGGFRLYVKVRDMTTQEEDWIYTFLDTSLDPDIEIHVLPWVFNPVSPAGIDLLRKLGGSAWIARQLEDICPATVELLPDDGFRLGYAMLGFTRIIPGADPLVLVKTQSPDCVFAIQSRLDEILEESIERRCS
jgi:hypothetical protein